MVERITVDGKLIAIIIRADFKKEGVSFFTPSEFSQQLAFMSRKAGVKIDAHVHNHVLREVCLTQEVLFIKKGKLRVDFYDDEKRYVESQILGAGDVVLLACGGHGFEVLQDVQMFEVKQGPYAGDKDKTRFKSVPANKLKIKN